MCDQNVVDCWVFCHQIIINFHDDDDMMAENNTCVEGTSGGNQTVTLCHGVSLFVGRDQTS
jgi:hypothetical protein